MHSDNRLDCPGDRRFRGNTVPGSCQAATRTSYDGSGRCCQTLGRIHATHHSRWPRIGCRGVLLCRGTAFRWTPIRGREPFGDATFGACSRRIPGGVNARPCHTTSRIHENPGDAADGSTGAGTGHSGGCGPDHRRRLRRRALETRTDVTPHTRGLARLPPATTPFSLVRLTNVVARAFT